MSLLLLFPVSGPPPVTGEGSPSILAAALSGTGTAVEEFTGTGSPAIPAAQLTGAGAGDVVNPVTGSGSPAIPAAALSGAGSGTVIENVTGSGSPAIPAAVLSGSGVASEQFVGSGSPAIPANQLSATGAGTETFSGSGTPAVPASQVSGLGSGLVVSPVTGSGSATIPASDLSGDGAGIGGVADADSGASGGKAPRRRFVQPRRGVIEITPLVPSLQIRGWASAPARARMSARWSSPLVEVWGRAEPAFRGTVAATLAVRVDVQIQARTEPPTFDLSDEALLFLGDQLFNG